MPVVAASASTPLSAGVSLLSFLARLQLPNSQRHRTTYGWTVMSTQYIQLCHLQQQEHGLQTPDHTQVEFATKTVPVKFAQVLCARIQISHGTVRNTHCGCLRS